MLFLCLYCHNPDTWPIGRGEQRTAQSLIDEYESVREFLKDGGITVTGGEPLLQIDFLTELFSLAKQKGIHTCIDTSGVTFDPDDTRKLDELLSLTDLVMLDIKHIDNERHKALTGRENKNILAFAEYLSEKGIPIWIRHVLVPTVTDNEHFLHELGFFIGGLKTLKALDVLPYHTMARAKYESLGINYPLGDIPPATKEQAAHASEMIMQGLKDRLRKN